MRDWALLKVLYAWLSTLNFFNISFSCFKNDTSWQFHWFYVLCRSIDLFSTVMILVSSHFAQSYLFMSSAAVSVGSWGKIYHIYSRLKGICNLQNARKGCCVLRPRHVWTSRLGRPTRCPASFDCCSAGLLLWPSCLRGLQVLVIVLCELRIAHPSQQPR